MVGWWGYQWNGTARGVAHPQTEQRRRAGSSERRRSCMLWATRREDERMRRRWVRPVHIERRWDDFQQQHTLRIELRWPTYVPPQMTVVASSAPSEDTLVRCRIGSEPRIEHCDSDECPGRIGPTDHSFAGYGWYARFHKECCPGEMDGSTCFAADEHDEVAAPD